MMREDWLARRIRKQLLWLSMQGSKKEERKIEAAKKSYRVLYSTRAAVRIQAWFRGWKARREVKRAWLLREKMDLQAADDLERLRRIQREAVHTSSELTDHKDMKMIKRTLRIREAEEHDRLTSDLRRVREAARVVDADLQHELELDMASHVIPLKELTDFLEAKRLREEKDKVRQAADVALIEGLRGSS